MVRKQPLCQREKSFKTTNDLNPANDSTSDGKKSKQRCNGCAWGWCQRDIVFKGSFIAERGSVFWHEQHSRPQRRVYSLAATTAVSFHRHTPSHRNTDAAAWLSVGLMRKKSFFTSAELEFVKGKHMNEHLRQFKRHNNCCVPLATMKTHLTIKKIRLYKWNNE